MALQWELLGAELVGKKLLSSSPCLNEGGKGQNFVQCGGLWKLFSLILNVPRYPDNQLTITCVCFMFEKQDYLYFKEVKDLIAQCCN